MTDKRITDLKQLESIGFAPVETQICDLCNEPHEVVRCGGLQLMGCPQITDPNMVVNLSAFKRALRNNPPEREGK